MIRIAICDNEKNMQNYLFALVTKQDVECEIREYSTSEQYLAENQEFDLVLLDIKLQVPGDGLKLAREIRNGRYVRQPLIIFITAYKEYVYDAFDVDAFQYLLKPVDEERFAEVFGRAIRQILSEDRQQKPPLVIQYAGASRAISLDSIMWKARDIKSCSIWRAKSWSIMQSLEPWRRNCMDNFFGSIRVIWSIFPLWMDITNRQSQLAMERNF